jgi:hypothetical protein
LSLWPPETFRHLKISLTWASAMLHALPLCGS